VIFSFKRIETARVYCAVRASSLNIVQVNSRSKRRFCSTDNFCMWHGFRYNCTQKYKVVQILPVLTGN